MSEIEEKEPDEKCNARKTDGSGYCQQPAGFGTDHVGHGRCKYHGGSTEQHEKSIIDDLKEAAGDAAVAYRLKLKHARKKAENGNHEDIDWGELDRMARTVFDRTGHGKEETQELKGDEDAPLSVKVARDTRTKDESD